VRVGEKTPLRGRAEDLGGLLHRIDGRGYKAYKDIQGSWDFSAFVLHVDHVQGDPFAAPSRLCAEIGLAEAAVPGGLIKDRLRRIALGDYLARTFHRAIAGTVRGRRGIGKSGTVAIAAPGQEILERNAVVFTETSVQCRFVLGLPARGRTILGGQAAEMLLGEVPLLVEKGLVLRRLPPGEAERHIAAVEDQEALREALPGRGLAAFVPEGAVLPRRSGVDPRPLGKGAVPFEPPPELTVELACPHRGTVKGMGIPAGVSLIVGGGFHGKSTLLDALQLGVYNHVPGDGREGVVTLPSACKVRAEDGRSVERVDISPFISNLPTGQDTRIFSTANASGSTSQAANIVEPLEAGCRLLLIDEDTSATNFMIRDERMQELVNKDREPITPFVDKVRQLREEREVSTVLVMGGSGDYFDVADTVIMMDAYRPRCVTARAREIAARRDTGRKHEGGGGFGSFTPRRLDPASFDPSRGKREVKIDAPGRGTLIFGRSTIDLAAVEQLVDRAQTVTIGWAIHALATRHFPAGVTLAEALGNLSRDLDEKGLDLLAPWRTGDLVRPRLLEIAAAINRLRGLKVKSA
jgi:predicted ABC-class ATPase